MLKDLLVQLGHIPHALMLSLLLSIAYLFVKENKSKTKDKLIQLLKQHWLAAFIFYTAFILAAALFSRSNINPYGRILDSFGLRDDPGWNNEIYENVIIFIPFTFLYIKAFRPKIAWKASLKVTFAASLFIEISQLVFWLGFFQLADIVHNIMGGMIGCGLWYVREKRLISRGWQRFCALIQSIRKLCQKRHND